MTELEAKNIAPNLLQVVRNTVYPDRYAKRDKNNDTKDYAARWWQFAKTREDMRPALQHVTQFIGTCRTAKHRLFCFLEPETMPDAKVVAIALEGFDNLTILTSNIHCIWSEYTGVRMGMGNDLNYNHADCFNKFPFPNLDDKPELKTRLSTLGEQLDSHRKARQTEHPDLTLTGMYNVLEKLRAEEPLNDKEKVIHDQGLVTLLKQIHDDIDAATYEAYGWSDIWQWHQDCLSGTCYDPESDSICQLELDPETTIHEATAEYREKYDQVLLQRLVDLNHLRAAEEAKGKIRYLRPDYQDPENTQGTQQEKTQELALPAADIAKDIAASKVKAKTAKLKWPKELPKQVEAVLSLIPDLGTDAEQIATLFGRKSTKRTAEVNQIITMLKSLGQIN